MSSSSAGARSAISPVPDRKRAASAVVASAAATAPASCSGCSCGQALGARRRLREPPDGVHDAIEFEGLEGAGLHGVRRLDLLTERNP